MMRAPSRWSWPLLTAWIVLPAMLWWCATLLDNLHLFILHQAYYLPLGTWMGEPFFTPDSEVMFFVMPAGRLLTALVCGAERPPRSFDRVENAVDMTKPSSAGPRDSAGYVECGTLDAKLKKAYRDAGYRDEQRMSRQHAMDFLSEAYRGNEDMRRMYESPKAMLDSATQKGRSNWYNSLIEQAHPGEF